MACKISSNAVNIARVGSILAGIFKEKNNDEEVYLYQFRNTSIPHMASSLHIQTYVTMVTLPLP